MAAKASAKTSAAAARVDPAPAWILTGTLIDALEGLDSLGSMPMPVPTAAKVCKIINWARPVHKGYTDERNEIVSRFGTNAGEGKFNIPAEKVQQYNNAMRSLQTTETASPPSEFILTMSDFSDVRLTPSQYARIQLFVKE
jgi:hypothetical protein